MSRVSGEVLTGTERMLNGYKKNCSLNNEAELNPLDIGTCVMAMDTAWRLMRNAPL